MHLQLATALLALSSYATAHILPRTVESRNVAAPRRCGGSKPSQVQIKQSLDLFEIESAAMTNNAKAYDFQIDVDVYVHVISSSKYKFITEKQIKDQIKYLNKAFKPYNVGFNHLDTDYLVNGNWSYGDGDFAMKKYLRRGSYKDLNLYYIDRPMNDGEYALGHCSYPQPGGADDPEVLTLDGCVIDAQTVPGGTTPNYNKGGTTVHEVGHWFHLFHTFEGGCDGTDEVWDTPASESASDGCPKMRDSCPGKPGIDPIHNFMDYSYDYCYEGFSLGQMRRMHSSWEKYRQDSFAITPY